MVGIIPPGTAALWVGNDTTSDAAAGASVFAMDLGGNLLIQVTSTAMTGAAFDGTNLWFSTQDAELTKRNTDGTLLATLISATTPKTEDLTFDSTRQLLWRIDHQATTLVQIDRTTGAEVHFPLDPAELDPVLNGAFGIAYDTDKDVLYVSFRDLPETFLGGVVKIVDPKTTVPNPVDPTTGTIAITGELFRIPKAPGEEAFNTGGLAYQPKKGTLTPEGEVATEGTLWVGDNDFVRHMSLSGDVIARVRNPNPGGQFVDGLEFVIG